MDELLVETLGRIESKVDAVGLDIASTKATLIEFKHTTEKNITALWGKYDDLKDIKPELKTQKQFLRDHIQSHPTLTKTLGTSASVCAIILGAIKLVEFLNR